MRVKTGDPTRLVGPDGLVHFRQPRRPRTDPGFYARCEWEGFATFDADQIHVTETEAPTCLLCMLMQRRDDAEA